MSRPGEEVGLFWATVHLFMFFNYSNKKFILLCHLFAVLLKGLKIIPDEKDFSSDCNQFNYIPQSSYPLHITWEDVP